MFHWSQTIWYVFADIGNKFDEKLPSNKAAVKQYDAEDLTIEGVQQWILDCRKHERRSQFSASLTQSFKSQINNQKNLESQASCSSSNNFLLDF